MLKRAFDVALSGAGLVLSAPLWAVFACAIKLEDGGPVFYSQARVGLNGRHFTALKFRSMRPDAEAHTGAVQATLPGQTAPQALGQFQLSRFVNKVGLESIGDNLFQETPASGAPQDGLAGADGYGDMQQGNLEQANVEAVSEMSDLIAAQRAYEMNSKVVSAADQMLQSTSGMFR